MAAIFYVMGILIVILLITKSIFKFSTKKLCFVICAIALLGTIIICATNPVQHKPCNIHVIEYLFKINTDGSITTIKETTHNTLKESGND